jgi:hypothetical protein
MAGASKVPALREIGLADAEPELPALVMVRFAELCVRLIGMFSPTRVSGRRNPPRTFGWARRRNGSPGLTGEGEERNGEGPFGPGGGLAMGGPEWPLPFWGEPT